MSQDYAPLWVSLAELGAAQHLEQGALDTAAMILLSLQRAECPAPLMTWHGGDAVVFLWSQPQGVRAMTVTQGEYTVSSHPVAPGKHPA